MDCIVCSVDISHKRSDAKYCSIKCANSYHQNKNKQAIAEYRKQWAIDNKDRIIEYKASWYQKNKERILQKRKDNHDLYIQKSREDYQVNKEKRKASVRKWQQKNKALRKMHVANRRARKLQATPKWANLDKIKEIYLNCPKGYHVDHIIPLCNENVTGLHVENNLQYLKAEDNIRKRNKLINI